MTSIEIKMADERTRAEKIIQMLEAEARIDRNTANKYQKKLLKILHKDSGSSQEDTRYAYEMYVKWDAMACTEEILCEKAKGIK